MITKTIALLLVTAGSVLLWGADPPQAEIANGQIKARLYLPDASRGFYRGTRFDWSGVFAGLEYRGHEYYGRWFTKTDASVTDFVYRGADIVAGSCSAITGPAEEFQIPLGYAEAKPGEGFVKIGVGVLKKPDASAYSAFRLYEIADGGKWTVHQTANSVEFVQELPAGGLPYGYQYRKTVRLVPGKPEMVLEHRLKNTGRVAIRSNVYGHNFLALDRLPIGPDFIVSVPFEIRMNPPLDADLARVDGKRVLLARQLQNEDRVYSTMEGFGNDPAHYDIRIENAKAGAGVHITGDRPLARETVWSIRSVLSVEPFIGIAIEPGEEAVWSVRYTYYTLPPR